MPTRRMGRRRRPPELSCLKKRALPLPRSPLSLLLLLPRFNLPFPKLFPLPLFPLPLFPLPLFPLPISPLFPLLLFPHPILLLFPPPLPLLSQLPKSIQSIKSHWNQLLQHRLQHLWMKQFQLQPGGHR